MGKQLGKYLIEEHQSYEEKHYHLKDGIGDPYKIFDKIIDVLPSTGYYTLKGIDANGFLLIHRLHRTKPVMYITRYPEHKRKDRWRIKITVPEYMKIHHPDIVKYIIRLIDDAITKSQYNL